MEKFKRFTAKTYGRMEADPRILNLVTGWRWVVSFAPAHETNPGALRVGVPVTRTREVLGSDLVRY
jgi:hypothetical protein